MKNPYAVESDFTEAFAVLAEGQRIGFVSCKKCGAAILIGEPGLDTLAAHVKWHRVGVAREAL